MSNITDFDAIILSNAIKEKKVSTTEVMSAYLDHIDKINPKINAIISMRSRDDLMQEAKVLENTKSKGWLHGIPFAIKDLAETKGLRTTWGSPIFKDHIPDFDSIVSQRIKDAGAIIIGKTNTPEFGLGSHSYNPVHGVTLNPYDITKTAGGSSGGAAAALAANLLPVADGSDMMGSLRNPGAFNNIYGFRPSWGLVPNDSDGDIFMQSLSTCGPMARNPIDLAHLLETLVGPNLLLPTNMSPEASYIDGLENSLSNRRIGWIGNWSGNYEYEPGILPICEEALRVYEKLGVKIEKFTPNFDTKKLWDSWLILRSWTISNGMRDHYSDPERQKKLKPEIIYEIESGLSLTATQIHEASLIRSNWFRYLTEVFKKYDALALPSAQVFPFNIEKNWPEEINSLEMSTYHQWMEVVIPVSIVGLPAINIPCGFNENNLPMGLQLFGAMGSDKLILNFAQQYHLKTDWPNQKKPIL